MSGITKKKKTAGKGKNLKIMSVKKERTRGLSGEKEKKSNPAGPLLWRMRE